MPRGSRLFSTFVNFMQAKENTAIWPSATIIRSAITSTPSFVVSVLNSTIPSSPSRRQRRRGARPIPAACPVAGRNTPTSRPITKRSTFQDCISSASSVTESIGEKVPVTVLCVNGFLATRFISLSILLLTFGATPFPFKVLVEVEDE